jgi:hypothetical protein
MFAGLMGINQVLVKLVNDGLAPIAQAAACARSVRWCRCCCMRWWMRKRLSISDGSLLPGVLCGSLFADRVHADLHRFRIHVGVAGHDAVLHHAVLAGADCALSSFRASGMTLLRTAGLMLAITGHRLGAGCTTSTRQRENALFGDIMCIGGAMCWAGIALTARLTKLSKSTPEMQLVYQLGGVERSSWRPWRPCAGRMLSAISHLPYGDDVRLSGDRGGGVVRVPDVVPGAGDLSGLGHGVVRVSDAAVRGGVRLADPR